MYLINKGVLFVFDNEVKRDILTYFRQKNVYCEAIKKEKLKDYLTKFKPMIIIKDDKVIIDKEGSMNIKSFNLEDYSEKELERIFMFIEKNKIEKFWNLDFFVEYTTKKIKKEFSDNEIPLITLSTGVDSTVLSIFLAKTLNRKIKCIYIDNGLNRIVDKYDLEYLKKEYPLLDIDEIDISNEVLQNLKGILDQDLKKNIVKRLFRENLDREIEKYTNGKKYKLVHGTIVTDTFNLFKEKDEYIAPFDCLIKPEVRELGKRLGLKDDLVRKLKFPVIGYGRKILGEINKEKLNKVKEVDYEFCKKIIEENVDALESQYIDVSIIVNDDINIMVYRVDRRIIDNNILSYNTCIKIIRDIEKKYKYINKSLLDISIDTDTFLVKR